MSQNKTPIRRLQLMGNLEGITLVLLVLIAVPLKYAGGLPILVKVLGPIHGLAFIIYTIWLIENAFTYKWKVLDVLKVFVAAFIPFGFLFVRPVFAREEARLDAAAVEGKERVKV